MFFLIYIKLAYSYLDPGSSSYILQLIVGAIVGFLVTLKIYWLERLNKDPYYLLDETSKEWVIPKIEELGRQFKITDFE